MYRYNMTSIFEVLPIKEILQTEELTKATSHNMKQCAIAQSKREKKDESIPRRYFLICRTCFWCASFIDTTANMDDFPYKASPICNDNRIKSLPIPYDEYY